PVLAGTPEAVLQLLPRGAAAIAPADGEGDPVAAADAVQGPAEGVLLAVHFEVARLILEQVPAVAVEEPVQLLPDERVDRAVPVPGFDGAGLVLDRVPGDPPFD